MRQQEDVDQVLQSRQPQGGVLQSEGQMGQAVRWWCTGGEGDDAAVAEPGVIGHIQVEALQGGTLEQAGEALGAMRGQTVV